MRGLTGGLGQVISLTEINRTCNRTAFDFEGFPDQAAYDTGEHTHEGEYVRPMGLLWSLDMPFKGLRP